MIEDTTFEHLKDLSTYTEYLVLLGCEGKLEDWVKGVAKNLRNEKVAPKGFKIEKALKVTTTGGRVDLVLVFDFNQVDVGKLTMWRLRFGDCSWLSDYVVNYASHHGYAPAPAYWGLEYDAEEDND